MEEHLSLMIPGVIHNDSKHEITAPFDNQLIATIESADQSAVELALTTSADLFRNRDAWLSKQQRIVILQKTAQLMAQQAESLAQSAAHEGGKPLLDSRVEVARAIDGVKTCIECVRTESGREIPMRINAASSHRLAFTQHEPIGPVVAVSAFNHPLNLIIHQVAPAIAAGNPVIIKPANDTPISCYRFVELLYEAGLPERWCQALFIDDMDVATALVTDPRVAFFSFIGSSRVGWMLRSKLAPGARCALEHGGAAPVIVTEKADIDKAIPLLAKGGFYHAGQVCVSVQRIFCHSKIAEALADRLATAANNMLVGDPLKEETEIGPLIRPHEVSRVDEWVKEARDSGAKLLCGGKVVSESCYAPTVIYNPHRDLRVSSEEIFGPVVCVYPYDDIGEAINRANALPLSFQSAVFTQNIDEALYISQRLNASAVMINDHTAFRTDWMPFAGLGQSGKGVGGIPYTFHEMQIEKMTVFHSESI